MSLPAHVLRALLERGTPTEAILAAAEAQEAVDRAAREEAERRAREADEERRARRREGNRKRQREWYDRNIRDNCDNAVSSYDNQDNAVSRREDVRSGQGKNVLEPIKTPTDIKTSSPLSEAQVPFSDKPRRHDWPERFFDLFWDRYPRKTDRKKAAAALNRVHRSDKTAWKAVAEGVERMRLAVVDVEPQFILHPTTFINGERWDDDWRPRGGGCGNGPRASPQQRPQSAQARALDRARQAHLELMGDDDGQSPFVGDAAEESAGSGYPNGHARPRYDEPFGGRPRLAPPSLAFPPRSH